MLHGKTKIALVFLMLLANWLLRTEATSADIFAERRVAGNALKATTLSLSAASTVTNAKVPNLFETAGLEPQGFDLAALRVRNEGAIALRYRLAAKINSSDATACDKLTVRVLRQGEEKYRGSLGGLSLLSSLDQKGRDDWVFFVGLDTDEAGLKGKRCDFDLAVNTYRVSPDEKPSGFFARLRVSNSFILGTW